MAIYLRAKGRTSPPAKTICHRESINPILAVLKLVTKYLVTTIYSNMQPKKRLIVNRWKNYQKVENVRQKGDGWRGGEVFPKFGKITENTDVSSSNCPSSVFYNRQDFYSSL